MLPSPRSRHPNPSQEPPADTPPTPDPESTIAAVDVLKAQLAIVATNLDSIDRKAALLPPFLVALGGLLLPPPPWTVLEVALIAAALATGIGSVWFIRRIIFPTDHYLGPKSAAVVANLAAPAPQLRAAIARELADSIDNSVALSDRKSGDFRKSANLAAAAILFLIAARAIGGLTVAEESGPQGGSPAPAATQEATPGPATSAPPPDPSTPSAPPALPGEQSLAPLGQQTIQGSEPGSSQSLTLGQQVMARDLLSMGQQTMRKGASEPARGPLRDKET